MKTFLNRITLDDFYSLFNAELSQNRIFGLDLLRFFAITTVIISHGRNMFPKKITEFHEYITFDGVTIFFVLSGFLIGNILIKQIENNKPSFSLLLDFWIRRWFRTVPTYFLVLSIIAMLCYIQYPSFTFSIIAPYYIFCQNLFYPTPPYFPESWSLSVEEWFYLLIPFLIFFTSIIFKVKAKIAVLVTVLIVLLSVSLLKYDIYASNDLDKAATFGHEVIFRLDSIVFGVIAACIHYYYPRYWSAAPFPLFISGIFIFLYQKFSFTEISDFNRFYRIVLEYSLTSFATLLLLPFLSSLKKTKYKIGKLITIISLLSYSMYLIHLTLVAGFILGNIPWTYFTKNYNIILPVSYFLYWALTILLSILIYKFYEKPLTNLREKFHLAKKR
ncbi:acyltransferase family protein [Chryseobacterium vrystaatense]|uniref:Acyltransferase 3 domain-containing protein n=1 Tax=Chryseobacterium vrystaatense TaxID=307480 RepID=A0ABR4UP01_9FLAO|nr:acyltransferase [Chryseobacterium vrystaatense]KFF26840.1 hypothetical protein IW16_06035 [Chryseobacterium vrystaatense]